MFLPGDNAIQKVKSYLKAVRSSEGLNKNLE